MGMIDRLMRASVDRAQRMQPRRIQRAVNEQLYSAPSSREEVASIASAARRLVTSGLSPATLGSVAARRSATSATVTSPGADLSQIDNRQLERVPLDDRSSPALEGVRSGNPAAVWAYPPSLLVLAEAGMDVEPVSGRLSDLAGEVRVVVSTEDVGPAVTVVAGDGALAVGADPEGAVTRLEAAESLARMTILKHTLRRTING